MKQLFKTLAIIAFIVVLASLIGGASGYATSDTLLTSLVAFAMTSGIYVALLAFDEDKEFESQDNWYIQLEDEWDNEYHPDRDY